MDGRQTNPSLRPPVYTIKDCDIKAIIFDLGNVLIDFDHGIAARRVAAFSNKSPQEIRDFFFDSELTGLFEEGRLSPEGFFLKIKEELGLRLDYGQFVPIWNEIFFLTEKNHKVYNLTQALKDRYKLALLSNIDILHFTYLKKTFPHLLDAFQHVLTSYELTLRKPHPLIYQKTLEILKVAPEEVFYTDDRAELIRGAKELGIRGVVFKDVEQLKSNLLDAGIKV